MKEVDDFTNASQNTCFCKQCARIFELEDGDPDFLDDICPYCFDKNMFSLDKSK